MHLLVQFANDTFLILVQSAIKECFGKSCAMVHFCLDISLNLDAELLTLVLPV